MRPGRPRLPERSMTDRIYAILETNQPTSMSLDQLALELQERFGMEPTASTLRLAVARLRTYGLIETRVEDAYDYDTNLGGSDCVTPYGVGLGYQVNQRTLVTVA